MTWRENYAPIIRKVLDDNKGLPDFILRKALRDKWDEIDGLRQYWPYKVWCDEIRIQRGLKIRKTLGRKVQYIQPIPDPNQLQLL